MSSPYAAMAAPELIVLKSLNEEFETLLVPRASIAW